MRTETSVDKVLRFSPFFPVLNCLEVLLEGERVTKFVFFKKIGLPFIPFLVVVVVTIVYLQYGGVCYWVERSLFWYKGCQLCGDGVPPVNGMCPVGNITNSTNSTNVTWVTVDQVDLIQGTYCSETRNTCFFNY